MADVKSSGLSVQVNVDVEDGLKALKALQREAKKTVQELKGLETLNVNMSKYSWDLSSETNKAKKALEYSIELGVLFTDLGENIRGIGKTTALIEKAHELNVPIIVGNTTAQRNVIKHIKELGIYVECYSANFPQELRGKRLSNNNSFIVDDTITNSMILELQKIGFKCIGGFNSIYASVQ